MEHIFRQWIGMHRAMIAWFHAAHHVTKGTGFGGDHVNLYGEIYTKLDEDLDGIIEKGIGLTGDETLADPVSSLSLAATLLSQQPASANQSAETIACNAFEVIKYYVSAIESTYSQFEASGMSLGLDDLLQGLANQYETYVYLLQQRSRTVSLQKENTVRLTESKLRKVIRKSLLEYGAGPEFDHLRGDVDNLTDGDMKAIADRFCQFVKKQDFEYINFRSVYYTDTGIGRYKDAEAIIIETSVNATEWKNVQKTGRNGRKYWTEEPVSLMEHGYRGVIPNQLFKGTKYLRYLRVFHNTDRVYESGESNTSAIVLHWHTYGDIKKRKLVFQELKEWLDQNENRQFSREDFGIPSTKN